jgi:CubicO group peptidase (beta-lactamase class C family)
MKNFLLLLFVCTKTVFGQENLAKPPATESVLVLTEFEGIYDYRDAATVTMVAGRNGLVAVIGEATYPLRAVASDTFANGAGDRIPFLRGTDGRIVAFQERGDTFTRRTRTIPTATRQLLVARPLRPDGNPPTYSYVPPPALADGIRVGEARTGTLPRGVAEQIVNGIIAGTYPGIRAIALHHKGSLVLEEYFYGYDRERPHQMRSLTKTVISLLAGVAVGRGLLRADEPVLARLGYTSVMNPDARKGRITLTDLLSNQSGLACDDHDGASPGNEVKLYETADWPRAFMDLPLIADPGTVGRYCSFGFTTAGRVIERAAGKPLAEFAHEMLFQPMGISRDDWHWTFVLDRSQRNVFGQIYLRPRDMLKLGLLIQQRGDWHGRRLISAEWIEAVIAKQSRVGDSDYGLGIWHRWYSVQTANGARRIDTIMLSGNGGQKVFLVPSLELIVVFTGGSFNAESPTNELMARVLLPVLIDGYGQRP